MRLYNIYTSIISKAVLAITLGLSALNSSAQPSHDITSLSQWGPYSKEYFGISHIADLQSGMARKCRKFCCPVITEKLRCGVEKNLVAEPVNAVRICMKSWI